MWEEERLQVSQTGFCKRPKGLRKLDFAKANVGDIVTYVDTGYDGGVYQAQVIDVGWCGDERMVTVVIEGDDVPMYIQESDEMLYTIVK